MVVVCATVRTPFPANESDWPTPVTSDESFAGSVEASGAELPPPFTEDQVQPPGQVGGLQPPALPAKVIPQHVAVVMDGNGRWANQRGLPRTEGHKVGEQTLLDVVAGAVDIGVRYLSVYAFSTENWRRSPEEVKFLLGFERDTLRKHRGLLRDWGVRVRWAGRKPKLWGSVIKELQAAEEATKHNTTMDLVMCVNYGGRAELVDAVREIADQARRGKINPGRISEKTITGHLHQPHVPDVDLFIRSGGEQRTSNFLMWQSAYAEMVFLPELWPDMRRTHLWDAITTYARRDRRYGGAIDAPTT